MTRELTEDEQAVARASMFGAPPAAPVREAPKIRLPESPEGVFSAVDLYAFTPPPVPYTMPNGKRLWVHPCSDEEIAWITLQSLREVRRLVIENETDQEFERRRRAQVYQVICCARTDEEDGAPCVFKPEHAEALRRNPGWWKAVRDICRLSDSLGTESEALSEDLRDFFDGLREWAETCCSVLNGASSETYRTALGRFASYASAIRQRGKLSKGDREALLSLTPEG